MTEKQAWMGIIVMGVVGMILLLPMMACNDRRQREYWQEIKLRREADYEQCLADGKKSYECRYIVQQIRY